MLIIYTKGNNTFVEINYEYDNVGNITSQTIITYTNGSITKVNKELYVYNELYELICHEVYVSTTLVSIYNNQTLKVHYDYDLNGNIKSIWREIKTGIYANLESYIEYNYDINWKDLLSSVIIKATPTGNILATYTYQYDAIGNIQNIYKNGILYEVFVYEGRTLVKYENKELMQIIEYFYNSDGIRYSKKIYEFDENNEEYVIVKSIRYFLENTKIIGEEVTENDITYTVIYYYDSNDELIGFNYTNTNGISNDYFYVKNLQNDIIEILDKDGNSIVKYSYDAFGRIVDISSNREVGLVNSFRYRSYYYDNETDLYYLQSRYYDATLGRFINIDAPEILGISIIINPIIGTNLFVYCYNNPIVNTDYAGYLAANVMKVVNSLNISSLLTSYGLGLYYDYATALASIGALVAANIFKPILKILWSKPFLVAGIIIAAVAIVVTAVAIAHTKALEKSDAKIREKVKKNSPIQYWTATVGWGVIDIGRGLTYEEALAEVLAGRSVFTVTKAQAYALALATGATPSGFINEIDKGKENKIGYYWHYHLERGNPAYIWYLF